MKKKKIFALIIAVLLPAASYLLVKFYSERDVKMPPRYFFDSVVQVEKRGKMVDDTLWHSVRNISFTNQLGNKVSLDDAKGKIIVLDFFFTSCPTFCPGMAKAMKRLQQSFKMNDTSIVQFISISIDPVRDSVPRLRQFADRYKADHDTWWFVTGDKKDIYDFALQETKASIADTEVDTGFIHTPLFFLLDRNRVVRGWYDGFDSVKQAQLVRDIPLLMLEKNKKKTFKDFLKELFERS